MIVLGVWMKLPDGQQARVGDLAFTDPDTQGMFQSEFRYARSWREDPRSFSIDPIHLGMRDAPFGAPQLYAPLGVFEDALPDDWGRRLLVRAHSLPRGRQGAPDLLRVLGSHGLGALAFGDGDAPPATHQHVLPDIALADLLDAALDVEAGRTPTTEHLRALFVTGSSPGGSRPKALVDDNRGRWIAKFPSPQRDGRFDVVGLEATCMRLARNAGITVPDTRLVKAGRRKVLLVRRYDVAPDGGRNHVVSLKTLCGERTGVYVQSYSEVANTLRRATGRIDDIDDLFRIMVFNAAIGNTDDHLKNLWMIHGSHGYVLAPAIDLVPDVGERREHCLSFLYSHACPTRAELRTIADHWNVADAVGTIDRAINAVAAFRSTARSLRVTAACANEIARDIQTRCDRLRG